MGKHVRTLERHMDMQSCIDDRGAEAGCRVACVKAEADGRRPAPLSSCLSCSVRAHT